ncbi:hypothetical protein BB558_005371 [Smittium angustum]|uniref:Uncharacterized protein n=1 Tax=Smittium angustum TaxID=133377 RepID=A0A2U1J0N1_SMIAN|nr:hypothetical protein BB558_005371 [Smittium angustum]
MNSISSYGILTKIFIFSENLKLRFVSRNFYEISASDSVQADFLINKFGKKNVLEISEDGFVNYPKLLTKQELVLKILEKGVEPDSKQNLFNISIVRGWNKVVEFLLNHFIQITKEGFESIAQQRKQESEIEKSISSNQETKYYIPKIDINLHDQKGFKLAISNKQIDITKLILNAHKIKLNLDEPNIKILPHKKLVMSRFDQELLCDLLEEGGIDLLKLFFTNGFLNYHVGGFIFTEFCKRGNIKFIKFLADNGADIDLCFGKPLKSAIENNHLEAAKYLVERGANTEGFDNLEFLSQLSTNSDSFDKKSFNIYSKNDFTVQGASSNGYLDIVKNLVENGADIHQNNEVALKEASENGYLDIVKYLVENGANIHADQEWALGMASKSGYLDVVKYLVEKGAKVQARENLALGIACINERLDIVKYLIENGADLKAESWWRKVFKDKNAHLDVVDYLVERGLNYHIRRIFVLGVASSKGRLDIVKFLVENGADIHENFDEALRWASYNDHLEIVKYLVKNGADIHAEDDDALVSASESGYLDVVKYLVENGADVHAEYSCALMFASQEGHLGVVKYLVENGVDIHVNDDDALSLASEKGHLEVVKYLVENGADVHAGNNYALRVAQRNCFTEIVNLRLVQSSNHLFPSGVSSKQNSPDQVEFFQTTSNLNDNASINNSFNNPNVQEHSNFKQSIPSNLFSNSSRNEQRISLEKRHLSSQNKSYHKLNTPKIDQTPAKNRSDLFFSKAPNSNNSVEIISPLINVRESFQTQVKSSEKKKHPFDFISKNEHLKPQEKNDIDARHLLAGSPIVIDITPGMESKEPNPSNHEFSAPYNSNRLAEEFGALCGHRKDLMAYKSALVFAKLAYLLYKNNKDLVTYVDLLVTLGDYGQAEEILFNSGLQIESMEKEEKINLIKIGITISMRMNKISRVGYLQQLLNKSQNSILFSVPNSKNDPNNNYKKGIKDDFKSDGISLLQKKLGKTNENNPNKNQKYKKFNFAVPKNNTFINNLNKKNTDSVFKESKISKDVDTTFNNKFPKIASEEFMIKNKERMDTSWEWYICGLSIFQSRNVFGWEHKLNELKMKYPLEMGKLFNEPSSRRTSGGIGYNQYVFETPSNPLSYKRTGGGITVKDSVEILGVVKLCWKEAVCADPRCWEAWSGLRNCGIISIFEEKKLIEEEIDWIACSDGNTSSLNFFKNYTIATGFPYSTDERVSKAKQYLKVNFDIASADWEIGLLEAERLLINGYSELTVKHLTNSIEKTKRIAHIDHSHVDSGAQLIALCAWVQMLNKDMLYAKAQTLCDYYGVSKLAYMAKSSDGGEKSYFMDYENNSGFGSDKDFGLFDLDFLNDTQSNGMAKLLDNQNPSSFDAVWNILDTTGEVGLRTLLPSKIQRIKSIQESSSASRTGKNNCVLGVEPLSINSGMNNSYSVPISMHTHRLCSTMSGESLCYFAIGCYHLACAIGNNSSNAGEVEHDLDYDFKQEFKSKNFSSIMPTDKDTIEARRWFAKATMYAPLSVLAWLAFGYTFYIVYDYDRAIQAVSSAVVVSNPSGIFQESVVTPNELGFLDQPNLTKIDKTMLGRNSHLPLCFLGTLYLNTKNLKKAELCFDASIISLLGIDMQTLEKNHLVDFITKKGISGWSTSEKEKECEKNLLLLASDSELLNEIGVLKLKQNKIDESIIWTSAALKCSLNYDSKLDFDNNYTFGAFNFGSDRIKANLVQKAIYCNNLSYCYKTAGNFILARKFAEMATSFDPTNIDSLLILAFIYYELSPPSTFNETEKDKDTFSNIFVQDTLETNVGVEMEDEMIYKCIDTCHQILSISPYNAICAELLEMALELAKNKNRIEKSSDGLNPSINGFGGDGHSPKTTKIMEDLDEFLSDSIYSNPIIEMVSNQKLNNSKIYSTPLNPKNKNVLFDTGIRNFGKVDSLDIIVEQGRDFECTPKPVRGNLEETRNPFMDSGRRDFIVENYEEEENQSIEMGSDSDDMELDE